MAFGQFLPITVSSVQGVQNGVRKMKTVYWFNPSNIGDTVTLQDNNGSLIWQGRCEVANESQTFPFPREIEVGGYQVPTIASGTLYIYCV